MEELIINLVCLLFTVGGLGVATWAIISGRVVAQGLDGLFLVLISLLTALVFSLYPLKAARAARQSHELVKSGNKIVTRDS